MKRALLICSFIGISVAPVPQTLPEYGGMDQRRQALFQDTKLTTGNVSPATFGRIATLHADGGQVYSQPLFVQGVTIGAGTFDLVIVATMNNSVFAFDANTYAQIWKANFGALYSTYPRFGVTQNNFYINTPVGCVSTPAVDRTSNWVFTVCPNSSGQEVLYKLSLSTGAVISSVTISGQYPGTGDGGDTVIGGQLQFFQGQHEQRAGLVISKGNVYVAFSSYNDQHPWHGWIFSYSESSLTRQAVFCTSPNGYGGGIWLTGDAPAVDSQGNLYFSTGNGDYDGTANFANSVLKLNSSLVLQDWFTPANWATLEAQDIDVSAGRIMLVDDSTLLAADRDYRQYVLSTSCMGHLQGSSCSPQLVTVPGAAFGIYGGLFFNGSIYVTTDNGPVYRYSYSSGSMAVSPSANTVSSFAHPGARLAMSAAGTSNAVLWAVTCASSALFSAQQGVLRAFDPVTLTEIYNSATNGGDQLGTFAKFNVPMVEGGRVFVPTGDGTVAVYGVKP